MSRKTWKEKTSVFLVTVHPDNFLPKNPWDTPPTFGLSRMYAAGLSLHEARAFASTYNKAAMEARAENPDRWDCCWAIAVCNVKNTGWDHEDCPERLQLVPVRRTAYTPEEIERMMEAARDVVLPRLEHIPPAAWWRMLIKAIVETGQRSRDIYREGTLPAWPHSTQEFYDTFRTICRRAGIADNNGCHGLRLAHFNAEKGRVSI